MHAASHAVGSDNDLLAEQIIGGAGRRSLADDAQIGVGGWRSQPAELSGVEVDALRSHDRPGRRQPVYGAELEPVLWRLRIKIIGGLDAPAARHVLNDDRGRTGDVAAEVSAYETGPHRISARRTHMGDELDLLAGVKLCRRC